MGVAAESTGKVKDVLVVGGVFREILNGDTQPRVRYGGSGLVAAVAAARLGTKVALASYVGDEDEEAVRTELRAASVDDSVVLTLAGASGTFMFPTRESGKRPWPMYRPAESTPRSSPQRLPDAAVVVVFGIPDYDPVAEGWLSDTKTGVTLIWDKQGWLSRARDSSAVVRLPPSRKVHLANEAEAIEDANAGTAEEAIAEQPPAGFSVGVVKQGVRGVTVVERKNEASVTTFVPSFRVSARSTIGTGDVFAGAFASGLARGDSAPEAARCGCAAVAVALRAGCNLLDYGAFAAVIHLLSEPT